jgi:hypothetical protein
MIGAMSWNGLPGHKVCHKKQSWSKADKQSSSLVSQDAEKEMSFGTPIALNL